MLSNWSKFIFVIQITQCLTDDMLCSNVPKCRCLKHGSRARDTLSCDNITITELLNMETPRNISALFVRNLHFTNVQNSASLTRMKIPFERIQLSQSYLVSFSWYWMPEYLERLTISLTTIQTLHMNSENATGNPCYTEHLKAFKILNLYHPGASAMRQCIPADVERLSINSLDLEEVAYSTEEQNWPKSLKFLQLNNNNISRIAKSFFRNLPANLTGLVLRHQSNIRETNFLTYLPTKSLTNILLQNVSITDIPPHHTGNLSKDNILVRMTVIYTFLKRIPPNLPSSLVGLILTNNKIAELNIEALSHLAQLKILDLSRNFISVVPSGLPVSLEKLFLTYNQITTIDSEALMNLSNLKILLLSANKLTSMPQGVQPGITTYALDRNAIADIGQATHYNFCSTCQTFNLEHNPWDCNQNMVKFLAWNREHRNRTVISMHPIPAICADGLPGLHDQALDKVMKNVEKYAKLGCGYNITHLKCVSNDLERMPDLSVELREVEIVDNTKIRSIPNNSFEGMTLLTRLRLENIGLGRIPRKLPQTLTHLNLGHNNITYITEEEEETIQSLKELQYLDLQYNMLHTFSVIPIQPLKQLVSVHLKGNPLNCDCSLWPFVQWVNNKTKSTEPYLNQGYFGECFKQQSKRGTDIRSLSGYYEYVKACVPPNCGWDGLSTIINCSYSMQQNILQVDPEMNKIPTIPANTHWKTIDLGSLGLEEPNVNLKHLVHLQTVILTNNSLKRIPFGGLPRSVQIIDVSNNNITNLPKRPELEDYFTKLQCIDLRYNNIRIVTEEDVNIFQYLESFKLQGNPLICDCKIRPLVSWVTASHDVPTKKRHDLEVLQCRAPQAVEGKTISSLTDADYCPGIEIPAVIGGLVAGVFLLILIFCVSLGYYQKRGRIKEREAILQGFRELLQQEAEYRDTDPETGIEDNSRKKYDAFLSYSTHDEDSEFAAMLSDELEIKHAYKLCIHERDFVPGVGIADNIVECIGASKRIILVLSRHFVSSPWCQYEVQVALTELHQKRKSKLLIPILLEDIDENTAGSVKTFLSLIKALKIPSDKSHSSWTVFWRELLKSMPESPIQEDVV